MQSIFDTLSFAFVAASPLPIVCLVLLTAWTNDRLPLAGRFVLAGVYWSVHLTVTALFLGFTGLLDYRALIMIALASYIPLFVFLRRPEVKSRFLFMIRDTYQLVLRQKVLFTAGVALCVSLLYRVITEPITGYDAQAYHIPFVYEWVQTHRFMVHPQWQTDPIGYYPCNWEALCSLMFVAHGDNLFLLVPSMVALIIWILATYGIARHYGSSPQVAGGCSLALGTMPIALKNVLAFNVDPAFAAFFAAGLFFGLTQSMRSHGVFMHICFACLGMMCGIKSSGVVYVVVCLVVLSFRREFREACVRHFASGRILIDLALLIVLGLSWQFRNYLLCGNPFGVFQVTVGSLVLFDGSAQNDLFRTTLFAVTNWSKVWHYMLIGRAFVDECGLPFLTLVLIGSVGMLGKVIRTPDIRMVTLAIGLAATCVLYVVTPYSGDNGENGFRLTPWIGGAIRYGFPFLTFCAVVPTIGFGNRKKTGYWVQMAGLTLCVCALLQAPPVWTCFFMVCALVIFVPLRPSVWCFMAGVPRPIRAVILTALGLVATVVVLDYVCLEKVARTPRQWKDVYCVLEQNQVKRLAYTRSHAGHLWYGRMLQIRPTPLEAVNSEGYEKQMRKMGLSVLALGPDTIPTWGSSALISNLVDSSRFVLFHGEPGTEGPFLFLLRGASD